MIYQNIRLKEKGMLFLSCVLLTATTTCISNANVNAIKLEIVVPQEAFYAGEIVYLEAILRNTSRKSIKLPITSNDILAYNFDFRIYDQTGKYIECVPNHYRKGGDIILAPNNSYTYKMPFYLCTNRNFQNDTNYKVKAVYGWKAGNHSNVIESKEKWITVLSPRTDDDKKAYRILYTMNPAFGFKPPDREYKYAYDQMTAYSLIPEKYPNSIYAKYALYMEGKKWAGYEQAKYVKRAVEKLEMLLKEYPTFHLTDEAIYYLGLAHQKLGDHDKASSYFKKVTKEFPNSEGAEMARRALLEGGTP